MPITFKTYKEIIQDKDHIYKFYEREAFAYIDQYRNDVSKLNTIKDAIGVTGHCYSALDYAIDSQREALVKHILAIPGVEINDHENSVGMTPLMQAADRGFESIFNMLISMPNIDVAKVTGYGWSALMFAVRNGNNKNVLQLLPLLSVTDIVRRGDNLFEKGNKIEESSLSLATKFAHVNVVESLLSYFTDISHLEYCIEHVGKAYPEYRLPDPWHLWQKKVDAIVKLLQARINELRMLPHEIFNKECKNDDSDTVRIHPRLKSKISASSDATSTKTSNMVVIHVKPGMRINYSQRYLSIYTSQSNKKGAIEESNVVRIHRKPSM